MPPITKSVGVAMNSLTDLNQTMLPFAQVLGMRFVSAASDRVQAEMVVREELCTNPPVLHGGAIMAFADTLGACATMLNLREGFGTTTYDRIEDQFPSSSARRHHNHR
jgi:1,4-dihydroxy-2-naphthoyl-CoA hydrolase